MSDTEKKPFDKAEHQKKVRDNFETLVKIVEQTRAISTPLREARDQIVRAHRLEEDRLNAEIHKAEEGLFSAQQELAMWARQLEGNRGMSAETGGPLSKDAE